MSGQRTQISLENDSRKPEIGATSQVTDVRVEASTPTHLSFEKHAPPSNVKHMYERADLKKWHEVLVRC